MISCALLVFNHHQANASVAHTAMITSGNKQTLEEQALMPGINQINAMDISQSGWLEKKALQNDEYDVRHKYKRVRCKTRTPYNHNKSEIDWGIVLFKLVLMVPLLLLKESLK